jgi:DNA-binding beta-propeller fold protein YncE
VYYVGHRVRLLFAFLVVLAIVPASLLPALMVQRPPVANASVASTGDFIAYVAVFSQNVIQPFDTTTDKLLPPINLGHGQRAVALSPDDGTLYWTNQAGSFGYLEFATGVSNTNVGFGGGSNPSSIAVTPNGLLAYVADTGGSKIVPFNAITKTTQPSINLGGGPQDLAITPDGTRVFVTIPSTNQVVVVSTATNSVVSTVSVPDPWAIAIDPSGSTAWVTSYNNNEVIPVDVATLAVGTPIAVGSQPDAVAITPDGKQMLVANFGSNTVTPILLPSRTVGTSLPTGAGPSSVAVTPDGAEAFVADATDGTITPIAIGSPDAVKPTFSVGGSALSIAIDPDQAPVARLTATGTNLGNPTNFDASASTVAFGRVVRYEWSFGDGSTAVTTTPKVSHTYVAPGAYLASVTETDSAGTSTKQVFTGHTMSRNGSAVARGFVEVYIPGAPTPGWTALVANSSAGTVTPVNLSNYSVGSAVSVGSGPASVVIDPQADEALVATSGASSVAVVRLSTLSVSTVTLPAAPSAVAFDPGGSTAYLVLANGLLQTLTVANGSLGPAIPLTSSGGSFVAIAVTPDGSRAYVANTGGGISVVDLAAGVNLGNISVGGTPVALAVDPAGDTVYVVQKAANDVLPIPTATNVPGPPIAVGTSPDAIAISPDGSMAFVANSGSNSVTPVNLTTNSAGNPVGLPSSPLAEAVTPNGQTLLVTTQDGSLVPVALPGLTVGPAVSVGPSPVSVSVTPDQAPFARLSIQQGALASLSSFSASGSTVAFGSISSYSYQFGDGVSDLKASPSDSHAYVAPGTYRASVTEVSTGGASLYEVFTGQTAILDGGPQAQATRLVVYPVPSEAFVTEKGAGALALLDTSKGALLGNVSLPSGSAPTDVITGPADQAAYVVDGPNGDVTNVSPISGSAVATYSLGSVTVGPTMALSPDGSTLYVPVSGAQKLLVLDSGTGSVSTTLNTQAPVSDIAVSPLTGTLYALEGTSVVRILPGSYAVAGTATVPSGATRISVTSDGKYVTVLVPSTQTLEVLDPTTLAVVGQASVGRGAAWVAGGSGVAYVANSQDGTVTKVAIPSFTTSLVTLPAGSVPVALALSSSATDLWVVNAAASSPSVIEVDLSSGSVVASVALPANSSPSAIALTPVNPPGQDAFASLPAQSQLLPIGVANDMPAAPIPAAPNASALAATPDGTKLLVASGNTPSLEVLTTAGSVVATVPLPAPALKVAVTPKGLEAFALMGQPPEVVPVSLASYTAGPPVALASQGTSLALDPTGRLLAVAEPAASQVQLIDVARQAVVATLSLASAPTFAVASPTLDVLYLVSASGVVTTVSFASYETLSTANLGLQVSGVAITSDGAQLLLTSSQTGTLTRLDLYTGAASGLLLGTASSPGAVAVTPDGGKAFVAEGGGSAIGIVALPGLSLEATVPTTVAPADVVVPADQAPSAQLTVTGSTLGTAVAFSAAGSSFVYSEPLVYFWNFGDGSTGATLTPFTTHTYSSPGSYTASLEEVDAEGTGVVVTFNGTVVMNNGAGSAATSASVPISTAYHPINPVRVADTRPGSGYPLSGSTLGPGGQLNVPVVNANNDGVPSTATAVVANITAVNPTATSYLTVWPTGTSPPLASTLNFSPGAVVPNLVEMAIGSSGEISIYNAFGNVDVIVDVEGWVGPASQPGAGLFNSVAPYRVCDTRLGSGVPANQCNGQGTAAGTLGPGQTLTIQVTGWPNSSTPPSTGTVPAEPGVGAVVLNVTATDTTAWSYLTIWPSGASQPNASSLNWTSAGQTKANRVIVGVDSSGKISIYNAFGYVDVVVDISGYFTDGSNPGATGTGFNGLVPYRICDTRQTAVSNQCNNYGAASGTLSSGQVLKVQVAGLGGVPNMNSPAPPVAVVLNVTATDTTGNGGYFTLWPDGSPQPLASDVNWSAGQTVANLVVVKIGPNGLVDLYAFTGFPSGATADCVIDVVGWYG